MNLRKNILSALLIALGFLLHQLVPGTIGSMKFDLMLSMIFIAILINNDFKNTIVTALLGGVITAMTTTFPGGQFPNIIDKLATCLVVYLILKMFERYRYNQIFIGILSFVGTIVSGTVFLGTARLIVGLPAPFAVLFLGIVIPTSITNIFVTLIIYNAVMVALKATRAKTINN